MFWQFPPVIFSLVTIPNRYFLALWQYQTVTFKSWNITHILYSSPSRNTTSAKLMIHDILWESLKKYNSCNVYVIKCSLRITQEMQLLQRLYLWCSLRVTQELQLMQSLYYMMFFESDSRNATHAKFIWYDGPSSVGGFIKILHSGGVPPPPPPPLSSQKSPTYR